MEEKSKNLRHQKFISLGEKPPHYLSNYIFICPENPLAPEI